MSTVRVITAVAAAISLTIGVANAADMAAGMEKCMVVKDGKGLIKEHKADCKTASNSCAGQNKAGEAEAFIAVPQGQCAKINAGDFSGVGQDVKDKIEGAK